MSELNIPTQKADGPGESAFELVNQMELRMDGMTEFAPENFGPPAPPLLSVENVTLEYKTPGRVVRATQNVSFDVWEADRFILLGASGCGKSTLLKAVGGFIAPREGRIVLDGRHDPGSRPGPCCCFPGV